MNCGKIAFAFWTPELTETATVVAVRRKAASQVIIDLRHEDVLAPAETDVELLGAMGPRAGEQELVRAALIDAARTLFRNKYGALPVLEGEKLVGMLTDHDLIGALIKVIESHP